MLHAINKDIRFVTNNFIGILSLFLNVQLIVRIIPARSPSFQHLHDELYHEMSWYFFLSLSCSFSFELTFSLSLYFSLFPVVKRSQRNGFRTVWSDGNEPRVDRFLLCLCQAGWQKEANSR